MAGRPRRSSVWNYFKYEKERDKCVCQVKITKDEKEVTCGKELSGFYSSNMKKHLRMHHKAAFQKFEQQEGERKKAESSMKKKDSTLVSQMTIKQVLKSNHYPKDSKKQLAITKKLAVFVGATNVPLSVVDGSEFRDFLTEMNEQYDIPGRKKVAKEIERVYTELKHTILLVLQNAKRINFCCDIWSKQGMTASFLGITVHCFTFRDKKRHCITLAVKRFESPHTGKRIADLLRGVIDEWNIPHYKVFHSLTDNGSNMVKAFNLLLNEEEEDLEEEDDESTGAPKEDELYSDDCDDSDEHLDDDHDHEPSTEEAIKQFEQCEDDHTITFHGWKRNSCFVHTLQLVVKEFERAPCFKSTLTKAHKIVKRVNKSCKATEMLIKLAKKKLVSNCPTRWDSTFLMISRLISVKDHISAVLEELGWNGLTASQWKQLCAIKDLLQPFAHQTNVTSSEESTSICMVIPTLKELDLHLKEVRN